MHFLIIIFLHIYTRIYVSLCTPKHHDIGLWFGGVYVVCVCVWGGGGGGGGGGGREGGREVCTMADIQLGM